MQKTPNLDGDFLIYPNVNNDKGIQLFKMKKILFLFIVITQHCYSQGNDTSKYFRLQGKVTGCDTGIIYLANKYRDVDDTCILMNGYFSFEGNIREPLNTRLRLNDGYKFSDSNTDIYIEPGLMSISVSYNNFRALKLSGSVSHKVYEKVMELRKNGEDELAPLTIKYNLLNQSYAKEMRSKNDLAELKKISGQMDSITKLMEPINKTLQAIDSSFILANLSSYVAAYMLLNSMNSRSISFPDVESLYIQMPDNIQNSIPGVRIASEILKAKTNPIGSVAALFSATDIKGRKIELSAFAGEKYVLLDFWGSWCLPCREQFPHLLDLYKKYHSLGLEIITIALAENDPLLWKKAIENDGIDAFYNILCNEEIGQKYKTRIVPLKILIDMEGKVIGRYGYGYKEQNIIELDKDLKRIFHQ